ncbi:MAG TPA: transcriptional repressor LexA [Anaerolineae bacterium]|nr:transcriptional repressor LexA [Anaerolineae bacterium]
MLGREAVELTHKQRETLDWIRAYMQTHSKPPTVREIGERFGTASSSVFDVIKALERKGYLTRSDGFSRCITLTAKAGGGRGDTVHVPIVGRIAAGQPILAAEHLEGTVPVDRRLAAGKQLFALRVHGDSMINAGILEGDLVIAAQQQDAQDGDVVVALVDDEATVKRFHRRRDGAVELRGENPCHKPIVIKESPFMIQGRVVAVVRQFAQ